jgi:hypothetical protein
MQQQLNRQQQQGEEIPFRELSDRRDAIQAHITAQTSLSTESAQIGPHADTDAAKLHRSSSVYLTFNFANKDEILECYWYCCYCSHGPYNVRTWTKCISCNNHVKCYNCREEIVTSKV